MKIGGYQFRKSKTLSFRMAKEGDTYKDGTPVPANYVVIVKVKDCVVVESTPTKTTINTENAKAISDMTGHSYTNMVYGAWKTKTRFDGNLTYSQMTIYKVVDGQVYTRSVKR